MPNQFALLATDDISDDEHDMPDVPAISEVSASAPAPASKPTTKATKQTSRMRRNYVPIDLNALMAPKKKPANGWSQARTQQMRTRPGRPGRRMRTTEPKPAPIPFEKQYPALGSGAAPALKHSWTSVGVATITSDEVVARPDPGAEFRRRRNIAAARRQAFINANSLVGTTGYDDDDEFIDIDLETEKVPKTETNVPADDDISDGDWGDDEDLEPVYDLDPQPATMTPNSEPIEDDSYDTAPPNTTWKTWGGASYEVGEPTSYSEQSWGDDGDW